MNAALAGPSLAADTPIDVLVARSALESLQGQLAAWGADVTAYARPEDLLARLHAGVPLPHWILTGNTAPARLAELRSSRFPVIVKPAKPVQIFAVIAAAGVAAGS
jgi:hypothetical protein